MTTLIFHGYLAGLFPDGRLQVEANSAAEAISALDGRPGFQREEGDKHFITLPGYESPDAIYEVSNPKEIHVLPFLEGEGGKTGAYIQVAIGVALIATGYMAGEGVHMISVAGMEIATSTLVLTGSMMVLGGVMSLLMPQPTITSSDQPRSNYLPANHNTTAIGTPIPLLIGRRRVFGQFLSFDIDAKDRAAAIVPPPASVPVDPSDPMSPEHQAWLESQAIYYVDNTGFGA